MSKRVFFFDKECAKMASGDAYDGKNASFIL